MTRHTQYVILRFAFLCTIVFNVKFLLITFVDWDVQKIDYLARDTTWDSEVHFFRTQKGILHVEIVHVVFSEA